MFSERSKQEELVGSLAATDSTSRLAALKSIKNSVIGNKRQKLSYVKLGAVQMLLHILSTEHDPTLLVQAIQALGSFATSLDGVQSIIENSGADILLKSLHNADPRVTHASLRALKLFFTHSNQSVNKIFDIPNSLEHIISMLSSSETRLAESSATILARCGASPTFRNRIIAAGAIPPLLLLLRSSHMAKQSASLDALSAITSPPCTQKAASIAFEQDSDIVALLLHFMKHSSHPQTKFAASIALGHLIPYIPQNSTPSKEAAEHAVHAVLVKLLGEPTVGADATKALISMVKTNSSMQRVIVDADAIPRLADLLKPVSCTLVTPAQRADALNMLGILSSSVEEFRRHVAECDTLQAIVAGLTDADPGVQAAACSCLRGLSRSAYILRRTLGTLGDIISPLLRLTGEDVDARTVAEATATLANMAVEYSSVKTILLDQGGIARFVEMASLQSNDTLRLHGTWALSSVVYMSTSEVKKRVMDAFSWNSAYALLFDTAVEIREKAALFIRNLLYNSSSDADAVVQWSNTQFQLIPSLLQACSFLKQTKESVVSTPNNIEEKPTLAQLPSASASSPPGVIEPKTATSSAAPLHTLIQSRWFDPESGYINLPCSETLQIHILYSIVNLSSASYEIKDDVVRHGWLPALIAAGQSDNDKLREAAVWAIINLSWMPNEIVLFKGDVLSSRSRINESDGVHDQWPVVDGVPLDKVMEDIGIIPVVNTVAAAAAAAATTTTTATTATTIATLTAPSSVSSGNINSTLAAIEGTHASAVAQNTTTPLVDVQGSRTQLTGEGMSYIQRMKALHKHGVKDLLTDLSQDQCVFVRERALSALLGWTGLGPTERHRALPRAVAAASGGLNAVGRDGDGWEFFMHLGPELGVASVNERELAEVPMRSGRNAIEYEDDDEDDDDEDEDEDEDEEGEGREYWF